MSPKKSTAQAKEGKEMPTEALFPSSSSQRLPGQDDYLTVIVTPKLTFQLLRRPEWATVEDISQDELRRGFLSRFPPALWMSSEKFSFRPALPPMARITEETTSLVFKIVSDEVSDERVLLGILRELEKSYEAIIRRAVNETRSEALQEQVLLQEQAEDARKELDKQLAELRKDNKSLRDQIQSIQKRLFLVEQEKDQLRKEQKPMQERMARIEKAQTELAPIFSAEQLEQLQSLLQLSRAQDIPLPTLPVPTPIRKMGPRLDEALSRGTGPEALWAKQPKLKARPLEPQKVQVDAGSQTEPDSFEIMAVSQRVDSLQQQLEAIQRWFLTAPR